MEKGEDILDRNREAPVTSYDMGLYDYDIIPDPYSPKFQRERSYSEKGLQVKDRSVERKRRRHHCHHHRIHTADTPVLTTTESEPNLRSGLEISTDSMLTMEKDEKDQILRLYATYAAVGMFIFLLMLTLVHYYGASLDRLFSCDKTRYNAVAYNRRGLKYYICKAIKTIGNPGMSFLEH